MTEVQTTLGSTTEFQPTREKLISAPTAAKILTVQTPTMYRLAEQGLIPFYRIGRRTIRFKESELLAYIESNRVAPVEQVTDRHTRYK